MSRKLTIVALGLALVLAVAVTPRPASAAASDDAPAPRVERPWNFFDELELVVDHLWARFVPLSWTDKSSGDPETSVSGPVGTGDTINLGPDFDPNGLD